MKRTVIGLLACFVGLSAAVFVHDAMPPATAKISATGRWGTFEFAMFKDGGSVAIKLRTKEEKEELLILDRRLIRNGAGAPVSRKDGLLYLGFEAMSAGLSLQPESQVVGDFQRLLDHQRRRWSVRARLEDGGYIELLSDFAAALDRTKKAIQPAETTRGK